MNVLVFGVGRSGTTAVYSLLQKILGDASPGDWDYVYEPFLWDRDTFCAPYEELAGRFQRIDALSVDGLYFHQQLPLFVSDTSPWLPNDFISGLLRPRPGKGQVLLKAIRACGRIRLFTATDPGCKVILVLRNPTDTINSVLPLFSFFGCEFHRDDLPRFLAEVNARWQTQLTPESFVSAAHRQATWWYYMNAFALETAASLQDPPLVLTQERLVADGEGCTRDICRHLGLEFKDAYVGHSAKKVGALSRGRYLTAADLDLLAGYDEDYRALLRRFGVACPDYVEALQARYLSLECTPLPANDYGINASVLARRLQERQGRLAHLEAELPALRRELGLSRGQRDGARGELEAVSGRLRLANAELATVRTQLAATQAETATVRGELAAIRATRAYRAYAWLRRRLKAIRDLVSRRGALPGA